MSRRRSGQQVPASYQIVVDGHLDDRWSAWFGDPILRREPDGATVLRGTVCDQAELHGLLAKVRDLGVALISVEVFEGRDLDRDVVPPHVDATRHRRR